MLKETKYPNRFFQIIDGLYCIADKTFKLLWNYILFLATIDFQISTLMTFCEVTLYNKLTLSCGQFRFGLYKGRLKRPESPGTTVLSKGTLSCWLSHYCCLSSSRVFHLLLTKPLLLPLPIQEIPHLHIKPLLLPPFLLPGRWAAVATWAHPKPVRGPM